MDWRRLLSWYTPLFLMAVVVIACGLYVHDFWTIVLGLVLGGAVGGLAWDEWKVDDSA